MMTRTVRMPATIDEVIATFRDKPLEFKPGEEFTYSNSGYVLLGKIIEKSSGQDYGTFLRETVLEPLEMHDTGYDHNATVLKGRASGYDRTGNGLANAPYIDMIWPHAAGALYSTVEDMARWDQALRDQKLLRPDSYKALFTPFRSEYAYGWHVGESGGRKVVSHGGGIHGFSTDIIRFPEEEVCAVVLSNVVPTPTGRIARDLARIALGEEVALPKARELATIDPESFDVLVGRYGLSPTFVMMFTREGDHYYVQATGQPRFEIFPESRRQFFLKDVEASVTFLLGDDGRATHVILHLSGRDQKAARLPDEPAESDEKPDEAATPDS
jgi:CubicO group peptidase (beta-lactamase class C family)